MKIFLKIYGVLSLILIVEFMISCSNQDNYVLEKELIGIKEHFISEEKAMEIAHSVLSNNFNTRGNFTDIPNCEYVIAESSLRNGLLSDTVAYILNYPNNKGFAVISTTDLINPVLAFSDEGNFSLDNEISKTYFIDKIGSFVTNKDYLLQNDQTESLLPVKTPVEPKLKITLSQWSPWNRYVVMDKQMNCPAGCVAIACTLIYTHSVAPNTNVKYHGTEYFMSSLIDAIKKGPSNQNNEETNITSSTPIVTYSYNKAVDLMAKLIYDVGKDVHTEYTDSSSTASSASAYLLFKNLKFEVPSGLVRYDMNNIANYLYKNHLIYIEGQDYINGGAHAWVIDGYTYVLDFNTHTYMDDPYFHCEWGWGGKNNGYFFGPVFNLPNHNYTGYKYFAVKIKTGELELNPLL